MRWFSPDSLLSVSEEKCGLTPIEQQPFFLWNLPDGVTVIVAALLVIFPIEAVTVICPEVVGPTRL